MLSRDELDAMKGRADYAIEQFGERGDGLVSDLARDVHALLVEFDRVRKLHREEQRRSADRLKDALDRDRFDNEGGVNV